MFDLYRTVKYNNAPMLSLCAHTPRHSRGPVFVVPLLRDMSFFIDLSGTSEPHLFYVILLKVLGRLSFKLLWLNEE